MDTREMQARDRRLSSRSTLFCRLVLPVAWIAGFGAAALSPWVLALAPGAGHTVDWRFDGLFVVLWAIGSGFLLWFARPLRDVWIRGDTLRVRGLRGVVTIPLEAIERVEESRHLRPKLVHVFPERRPGLPGRVSFIPALRRVVPIGPHPVIRELYDAAQRTREEPPAST